MSKTALKLAASTILLGGVLVSCSASQGGGRPQTLANQAQKALQVGKTGKALVSAEAAVAADPRNATLRRLLANTYLAEGRFASARQSFDDALALGDTTAQTVISLALMHVADGRGSAAQSLLEQHRGIIPAGDFGLAMSLAGDTGTGVQVLTDEVRRGGDSAKVRQNLAFAYALDGRWREAQVMAGQDLDPKVAQDRIAVWARIAHPQAHVQRVASVLGVTPAEFDAGQPVRLALANNPSMAELVDDIGRDAQALAQVTPVATAELPPVEYAASATVAPVAEPVAPQQTKFVSREMVQALPGNYRTAPVRRASRTAPVQLASRAPVVASRAPVAASRTPIVEHVSFEKAVVPASRTAAAPVVTKAAFKPVSGGAFAVQLGVFSNTGNADRAWAAYSGKHQDLAAFSRVTVPAKVGARTLHRLTANGFADERSARAMCAKVRASGGECIIAPATSAPRGAATQIAARR
ncbi:SPOR domain-containing protein [Blastomonas sp.]|uniref:SPOR domain-containing protein n=1 Tax=Blastomonas sp. TaxID=1909299 RepID=UPI0035946094